jgi:predicted outer membrane repeat protein
MRWKTASGFTGGRHLRAKMIGHPALALVLALALALGLVLFLCGTARAVPTVIYVDQSADAPGTGTSWDTAYTDLQSALTVAVSGSEIWVAEGTYKPTKLTSASARSASFTLLDGVALYGGFAGTEAARADRNPATHETTLSGDIGTTGVSSDNSFHVVYSSGLTSSAVLDGFTVTGGNANGVVPETQGGGMYNNNGSPTLTNVTFSGNMASYGGGMYNNGSPTLTNVTFSDNTASTSGGGMHNSFSYSTLTNVTFSKNTASAGGGMYNSGSSLILTNVTFSGNSATENGGGMYSFGSYSTLTNVTFSGNSAAFGGGMYNEISSSPTLTNVTFSGNTASTSGGGMWNGSYSSPTLTNCILWGDGYGEIYNDATSSPTVIYSIVQGGHAGTGNKLTDPTFVDAVNGDLHLKAGSPAIDAGTNTGAPATDLGGRARPLDGDGDGTATTDMGAYEVGLWRVDKDATGTNTGVSWTNAFTDLQSALAVASSGDQIWVAEGTYKPTMGTDRTKSFTLLGGVALYGGFDGTETARTDRNPVTHATILSGDIGTTGVSSDNSFHVVYSSGLTSSAVLDGFTVTGGNANGLDFLSPDTYGGGMYNDGSSPTLTNVTFRGNSSVFGGGAMYNDGGSPTLTNVAFIKNSTLMGGGMYNDGSSPTLTNVTFSKNSADSGAGIYDYHGSAPTLTNCILWGDAGGEIIDTGLSASTVTYSIVQGGWTGTGNKNADPLFVDVATDDLHLSAGSPAIDAATNTGAPLADLDGNLRPLDGDGDGTATTDMGAYEHAAMPGIAGLSPTSGPTAGGTTVTITGANLTGASAVSFGTTAATSFTVVSATEITATSPPGSAGAVHVTVATTGGTSASGSADEFTYTAAPSTYTLTYLAGTGGTISGTTPQTVASGASGTAVTAHADPGYHFVSWSDDLTTAARTDTGVTADHTYTATFARDVTHPAPVVELTYRAGTGGSITGTTPQTVATGGSGTPVTAVANAGYHFLAWSDGVATATRTDRALTRDIDVTARFAINTYVVLATAQGHGSVSPASQTVDHAGTATITITPEVGYHIASITVDGSPAAIASPFVLTQVTAAHTVAVTFAPDVVPVFSDVLSSHRFYTAITYLAGLGIVGGYDDGSFGPADTTLRAQVAKMLVLALGDSWGYANGEMPVFTDVPDDGHPYPYPFVMTAVRAGVVVGFADGTFRPYAPITRMQLVRMMVRAAGDRLITPAAGYDPGFTDIKTWSAEDQALVALAKSNGLIQGTGPTTFAPAALATRGQVAQILYNLLQLSPDLGS